MHCQGRLDTKWWQRPWCDYKNCKLLSSHWSSNSQCRLLWERMSLGLVPSITIYQMLQLPIFANPRWLWNLASTFLDVAPSAEDPCGRLSQTRGKRTFLPQLISATWNLVLLSVCASQGRESVDCPGESFCPWPEPLPRYSAGGGLEYVVVRRCARIPLELRSVGKNGLPRSHHCWNTVSSNAVAVGGNWVSQLQLWLLSCADAEELPEQWSSRR